MKWNKTSALTTTSEDAKYKIIKDVYSGGYNIKIDNKWLTNKDRSKRGFRTLKEAKAHVEMIAE